MSGAVIYHISICYILIFFLYLFIYFQNYIAFNLKLRVRPVLVQDKLGDASIRFPPNRDFKREEFPFRDSGEWCKNRDRKEEQEQKVVGAGDCL